MLSGEYEMKLIEGRDGSYLGNSAVYYGNGLLIGDGYENATHDFDLSAYNFVVI